MLKLIPNIIESIPFIAFILSLGTADSPNVLASTSLIVFTGVILIIQLYCIYRKEYKQLHIRTKRSKDYSKDFADLCLRYEVIAPPVSNKKFKITQTICYDENQIKRIIGKKVIENENV
jgi:hypothetical protein